VLIRLGLCIFAALALVLCVGALSVESRASTVEAWKPRWAYSTVAHFEEQPNRWIETASPCLPITARQADAIWLKTQLPQQPIESSTIYIRAMDRPFQIYVGNQVLYQFGISEGVPDRKFLGFPWHLIPLPLDAAGKELRIRTIPGTSKAGICTELYLAPAAEFTKKLATDGLDRGLVALFALLCGIAGIVVAWGTRTWRPYLAFSGYSFAMGAWVFGNTSGPAARMLLIPSPRFWAFLDLGGLYLVPVFLALLFRQIVVGNSFGLRALRLVQWLHLGFALVVLPLGIADILKPADTLGPFNRVIPIFLALVTFETLQRLRQGRREEQLFAVGILAFLSFGVHDYLVATRIIPWNRHIGHWGHVGLLASLTAIMWLSLRRQLAERDEYLRLADINARANEKAKGAFHDIKTQIAALGSKIDSLFHVPQETRDSMKSNLRRMRAILTLQIEEQVRPSKSELSPQNVLQVAASIGGVLTVVDEDLAILARERGVAWSIDIPKWAYQVFVPMRAGDLQRAVSNLAENAVQAAAEAGRRVILSVERTGDSIQVAIRDFGTGFSETALRAFERKEIYTSKAEGHGRGLISTRDLLEASEGKLQVLSSSTGTVVAVALPITAPPAWFFNMQSTEINEVLVLDDDEEIAERLRQAFPLIRFTSFLEESDFLRAARIQSGAFLFVDYGFAGKRTGLDLVRAEGLADRAILFTGRAHFDLEIQTKAIAAGIKILPKECLERPRINSFEDKVYLETP
jgi:signal transduction histidine kinase